MFTSMKSLKYALVPVISGSMILGMGATANAQTTEPAAAPEVSQASESLLENETQMTQLLQIIDSIPEEVLLQGDEAKNEWLAAHVDTSVPAPGQISTMANFWTCSGAIATVVASTAFPAAKILKIKRYINALGGVSEAVRVMWGASFSYEKVRALGGAAEALAGEIIGITEVKQGCFS